MKKQILTLFMVGALTISAFAFPVTARADEPEDVNTEMTEPETESTETATEEGTEVENQETESTETGPETETAPEQPVDDTVGDELAYTLNTDTHKSDETPCQVTSAFYIPSGFHLNAYMDIMQDDGTVYRILTTDDNGYSDFAFVKPGHYLIQVKIQWSHCLRSLMTMMRSHRQFQIAQVTKSKTFRQPHSRCRMK